MMTFVLFVLLFAYLLLVNVVFVRLDGKAKDFKGLNGLFILVMIAASVIIAKVFTSSWSVKNWLEVFVNSGFCILASLGIRDLVLGIYRKDDKEYSNGVLRIIVSFVLPLLYAVFSFSLFSVNFTATPLSKAFGVVGVLFLGLLVYCFLRKSELKKNPLKSPLLPSLGLFILYLYLMCILFISPQKPTVEPGNEWLGLLGVFAFTVFCSEGMRETECGSRDDDKKRFSNGMLCLLFGMVLFFVFFALMYKV